MHEVAETPGRPDAMASEGGRTKVMITVNTTWNLVTFRAGLIRALIAAGYDVVAVAPRDAHVDRLLALGCRYVHITIDNAGTNPLRDLLLLGSYWRLLRRERPSVVIAYTVKPNVFGSIAAHSLGVPVINNIAGLGTAFLHAGWLNRIVVRLYRSALSKSKRVFFQNREDMARFIEAGLVQAAQAERLPGSGINPTEFAPRLVSFSEGRPFRFLMVSRLLWDKGVGEYVEAARRLRTYGFPFEACLLGMLNVKNRTAVPPEIVDAWVKEGVVNYLGETNDVRPALAAADCVVLPSYAEGTPRSLLEGASMGKPIITTDTPGCRDVVDEGQSGLLVPVKDAQALMHAMKRMLELPPAALETMGANSRRIILERFDEAFVISAYLRAVSTHVL